MKRNFDIWPIIFLVGFIIASSGFVMKDWFYLAWGSLITIMSIIEIHRGAY